MLTWILRAFLLSHSLRSAWIEICKQCIGCRLENRSHSLRSAWIEIWKRYSRGTSSNKVALLTECVDRNLVILKRLHKKRASHSLRSAWIEIVCYDENGDFFEVALLTECVDRNMTWPLPYTGASPVALLTECVDRNTSH